MPLTIDKPYLVLRTGMKDGKQVALVMDGDCADGITQDKPRTSLRTGTKDGKQVQLVADQKLDPDGKLIIGKPYLALRTGMKDGKLVVLVAGKQCEGEICDFLSGERETPYPTTVYGIDTDGVIGFFVPGITWPFPMNETSPGSRQWEGTQLDSFGATFLMRMGCNDTGFGCFWTNTTWTGNASSPQLPVDFDPLIVDFTGVGTFAGVKWSVIE